MQIVLSVVFHSKQKEDPLFRTFEWPFSPRQGEKIILDDPRVNVTVGHIFHYFDLNIVEVTCRVSPEDFDLLKQSGWSSEVRLPLWSRLKINHDANKHRVPPPGK